MRPGGDLAHQQSFYAVLDHYCRSSTPSASRSHTAVDAVELFSPSITGGCHALPNRRDGPPPMCAADPDCGDPKGCADRAKAGHTYGLRITPNGATFRIDGLEVSPATGQSRRSEPFPLRARPGSRRPVAGRRRLHRRDQDGPSIGCPSTPTSPTRTPWRHTASVPMTCGDL
jgi:hypothetical protein